VFRKCVYFMAFLMSVVGACHAAEVFPGGPRFDGTVTIVALTGASCSTLSDQPGDVHTAIFRTKSNTSSLPEGLQITMPRGLMFIEAQLDGFFRGRRQVVTGFFLIDAYRTPLPDGALNLIFKPRFTSQALSFEFDGTWRNYRSLGCTATVHGAFTRRPPE